jgi:hypothetical protein
VYAKDKMLWMGGTAEDENALKNLLSVSQIEFTRGDGDTMHLQTFEPPVMFESIPEENRRIYNKPPEPVVVEKGGGCDAGFGAGVTMLTVLAACLAARKSAAKKAR